MGEVYLFCTPLFYGLPTAAALEVIRHDEFLPVKVTHESITIIEHDGDTVLRMPRGLKNVRRDAVNGQKWIDLIHFHHLAGVQVDGRVGTVTCEPLFHGKNEWNLVGKDNKICPPLFDIFH